MTLLERLDEAARCPHYNYVVRDRLNEAATEIRRLSALLLGVQEEMDRQIAIRDEKIASLEINLAEYLQ